MVRREIFTRLYWREFRRDLFRFRKDKRARGGVLFRSLALAYLVAVFWFYGSEIHSLHDTATYVILGILLSLIAVVIVARKISHGLDARRQFAEDLAATPPGVAERLQRLALGALACTQRALSELWLAHHTLPEGYEAQTRRIQIGLLRKSGVWDEMPTEVREWMMRPDGEWPIERSAEMLAGAETLHTLLWALFLTKELRPLDQLVKPLLFEKIAKALRRPARGVRPTWDLRVARNQASEFFFRCYAENIHRGEVKAQNEEQHGAVEEWINSITEGRVADDFAGNATIAELEAGTLGQVGRSSACRMLALSFVLDIMEGKDQWIEITKRAYDGLLDRSSPMPQTTAESPS